MERVIESRLNRKRRKREESNSGSLLRYIVLAGYEAGVIYVCMHTRPLIWEQFIGKWSRRAVYAPPSYYAAVTTNRGLPTPTTSRRNIARAWPLSGLAVKSPNGWPFAYRRDPNLTDRFRSSPVSLQQFLYPTFYVLVTALQRGSTVMLALIYRTVFVISDWRGNRDAWGRERRFGSLQFESAIFVFIRLVKVIY